MRTPLPRAWMLGAATLLLSSAPLAAQNIPRSEYIRFVPYRYPRLVRQTAATVELQLFGDTAAPGYRDESPRNGIDDARDVVLMALAVRFSPYLAQNTSNRPMDWKKLRDLQSAFPLFVDQWETAVRPPQLAHSVEIDMKAVGRPPCPDSRESAQRLGMSDDCTMLQLLRDFDPDSPQLEYYTRSAVPANTQPFSVVYFDFPGYDPATWKAAFEGVYSKRLLRKYDGFTKSYVHPFIAHRDGSGGYELLFQYWFFYPYNDGGNKHEGDWEHVNVSIAPRSKVNRALSPDDIRAMLARDASAFAGDDPLVIRRVEHYIHDHVMTLDYSIPNAYLPRKDWKAEMDRVPTERVGQEKLMEAIRYRAYADRAETIINTHPVGYIGGDSKGPELLLGGPGSRNRDSHATYPFRGLYKDVGPAGAAEEQKHRFDIHDYPPGGTKPWPDDVVRLDTTAALEIVPDWERVADLAKSDPEVRREWSWILLPIRWGYPASVSPLAGIIGNAETGNLAPVGPSFSGGWNRPGANIAFSTYDPNQFSSAFPLSATDAFRNDFGVFNIFVIAFTTLPPFDLLYKAIGRPLRSAFPPPTASVFVPAAPSSFRVVGGGLGVTEQFLDENKWPLLFFNGKQVPSLARALVEAGVDTNAINANGVADNATSLAYQITFFLGPRFASENTVRHTTPTIGLDVLNLQTQDVTAEVRGELNMWEYAGSIRYNLATRAFQPYLKVGYGLTWYRLTNVRVNDKLIAVPDADWIRQPTISPFAHWLPNSWHFGAGIELVPIHPLAPLTGVSVGFKVEYAVYNYDLGLTFEDRSAFGLTSEPMIHQQTVSGILVVAF